MKNDEGSIFLISAINKEINFLFDNFLSELEITKTESMYLRLIHDNPGVTQYEIAKLRKIEKSLVTKYITNLEDKGLIEKKLLDKRKKGLYLIEDGKKAIEFLNDFIPDLQKKFSDLFTDEESLFFNNLLKKLKTRLEEINEREL